MAGTPTAVLNVRETGDVSALDEVVAMDSKLHMLENDKNRLMIFANSLNSEDVENNLFYWQKDEIVPKSGTTGASAASAASGATANLNLSGDSTANYRTKNDIIKFPATGHIYRINNIPTDATGAATVNATCLSAVTSTIASGAQFVHIGNAFAENSLVIESGSLNSTTTVETQESNYTQTFRKAVGMSRREQVMKKYSGDARNRQRLKKLLEHCEEINNALWHGVSGTETNGQTRMGGLISYVPAANAEAIPTLTEDELDDFIRANTRYGAGSDKVLFVSRFVAQTISQLARDSQRITSPGSESKWGVQVTEYLAGVGTGVKIVVDHALEGIPGSTAAPSGWDGYAVFVDPTDVGIKKLGGCFMQLETDIQENDRDGVVDAYKSDIGLCAGHPSHHGLITGVTG